MMKKFICLLIALLMLAGLTACSDPQEADYVLATKAMESGNYAEAYPILLALGDYKDAKALVESISAEKQKVVVDIAGVSTEIQYTLKNGNVVKEVCSLSSGEDVKNYYKFNEDNLCTSEIHTQADGSKININHFYEGTLLVRTIRTNANGSKDTFEYTCDESGKITAHTLTFSNNSVQKATYTYNEQGLLVQMQCTGANEETLTYEYNEFGDVVKEISSIPGGEETVTTYTYTYIYSVN